VIDLKPPDNTLVAVAHTYFAGARITFLTGCAAQVRVQKGADGFTACWDRRGADASRLR
jgi:hypothetical protein